jgi:hypothetical protein
MTTLSSYLSISKNLTKYQTMTSQSAAVATQTKYFQANIGAVTSAAELVKNPRLFNYAMTAFGLGDRLYAKSLMTQVMQQGLASSSALANKLNDPNIKAFAQAFDFAGKGAGTTTSSTLAKQVTDLYVENQLEADQAARNPGVQLALYFQRKAPSITSAYGILADKKILTVVQTALDISPMSAYQPIDQQAALLKKQVTFADFQDPVKLQKFITRFAAMYDSKHGATTGTNATNAILFGLS